jgi:hypothetical protein
MISTTENSNEFEKTKFWKEKSFKNKSTFGLMAQVTLVDIKKKSSMKCILI